MDIFLVRHTNVLVGNNICYGRSEVGIAETFPEELRAIENKLPKKRNEIRFYSSPSKRCVVLAEALSNSPPVIDHRILELNFGDWELKRWDDIDRNIFDDWARDFVNNRCPNGESYLEMYQRCIAFWNELIEGNHLQAVIITHSGIIRAIIAYLLEIPLQKSLSIKIDYGSVSKVKIDNEITTVEYLNR